MNTIEVEHSSFSVPVEIIAAGLNIEVELVRPRCIRTRSPVYANGVSGRMLADFV
jgi:hypothetical protein